MKKDRQSKLVVILALCVSVVGLTLGFAAFSNTLTISSSATVSPNSSDFNINVYGIENWGDVTINPGHNLYTSSTLSVPIRGIGDEPEAVSATTAKISDAGSKVTISDINVGLSEPGQVATYFFMIKNEGQYDAYVNLKEVYLSNVEGTCTPDKDTDPDLVDDACGWICSNFNFDDSNGSGIIISDSSSGYVKIEKDDYIIMNMYIEYGNGGENMPRADGDFTVAFDDIEFNFTSAIPTEE